MSYRVLCLSAATALLFATFACTTEAPPTRSGGSDVTEDPNDAPSPKKAATKKGKGDPAPKDRAPSSSTAPEPSTPVNPECAQTKDQLACIACCDPLGTMKNLPGQAETDKCSCNAAKAACSPVCAQIWCGGGEDTENCDETCKPDVSRCIAPLIAACEKDERCRAAKRCSDESKCTSKAETVIDGS